MKKFKDIRNIHEVHSSPPGFGIEYGKYKVDKTDKSTVNSISASVAHELNKSYMNPYQALVNLRVKLNTINLDFDLPEESSVLGNGSFNTTLRKAAADFGKDGDTPYDEYIKDDGSTGLTLKINIKQNDDNLFKLTGSVT